jgi:hypothetical protein
VIVRVFFTLVASLSFLYLFWRKLKEDYTANQIFNTAFYVLFGIFLFSVLAAHFAFVWSFWLSFVGGLFGLIIGISRYRLKVFEALEGWVLGLLGLTMTFYTYNWLKSFSLTDFAPVVVLFLFIFFYFYMDSRYKQFTWYRSGRIGFAGLVTLGGFFLVRGLVALFYPDMLFFVGKSEPIISGIVSFAAFLILFNLARRDN